MSSPSAAASASARPAPRWLVAALVILASLALAFLLGRGSRGPRDAGAGVPSGAVSSAAPGSSESAAFSWPGGPELSRSYPLAAGEALSLRLSNGDLLVRRAEGDEAHVRVELAGGTRPPARFRWDSSRDDEGLLLRIDGGERRSWWRRIFGDADEDEDQDEHESGNSETALVEGERVPAIAGRRARLSRLFLELPPGAPLHLRTGAGRVELRDHAAPVEVHTGAGDVWIERVAADAELETGAGDVGAREIAGDLRVRSGAGEVHADGVAGALDVSTGAGAVRFSGAPASVRIETGAGAVEGRLESLRGPVAIDTGMGGISLRLAAGAGCRLEARSGLGSVEAHVDGRRVSARRGETLELEVGGGGPTVRLRTGTGSVRVESAAGEPGSD